MSTILVATPDSAFGELLRFSLEGSDRHEVHVSPSCADALARFGHSTYEMVIIDCSLQDCRIEELARNLQEHQPAIILILIPPDNDPHHPSLAGLRPAAYLNRPVYLPTMLKVVEQLLSRHYATITESPRQAAESLKLPAWLQDQNAASSKLSELLPSSSANAVFVCKPDSILASAGFLPPEDLQEITSLVSRYWDNSEKGDLARFIHPGSGAGESLVYVTALDDLLALGMVFNNVTPLTRSRQETVRFSRSLKNLLTPEEVAARAARREGDSQRQAMAPPHAQPVKITSNDTTSLVPASLAPSVEPVVIAASPPVAAITTEDPAVGMHPAPVQAVFIETPPDLDALIPTPPTDSVQPAPSSILAGVLPLTETASASGASADILPRRVNLQDGSVEETPGLYYTCLLLPQLPEHHLSGDLAAGLREWLPEMCLAFGWKSCKVNVNEEYLQITVQVAPVITPGSLLRVLRELTSQQVFAGFPDLAKQNTTGDFWAPGHLIISGTQSPTGRMVKEFIEKTRRRQGFQP